MKNKIIIAILSVIICISLAVITYSQTEVNSVLYPIEVNGKYGYINKSGRIVVKPQYDDAKNFSEGLALILVNGKWGYINNTGTLTIKPQFDIANSFSEGLAAAGYEKYKDGYPYSVGYINKFGKFVIKPERMGSYIYDFKDGVVAILSYSLNCGFMDKTGKVIVNPEKLGYSNILDGTCVSFSDGLLTVQYNNGYGYINKQGKLVIKTKAYLPKEREDEDVMPIGDFYHGIASIEYGNKEVYINKKGAIVKNPPLDIVCELTNLEGCSEGLALKYINDKYVYTDQTGKIVINQQFDIAEPFKNGLASVEIGNKYGYIDRNGKFVWFRIKNN